MSYYVTAVTLIKKFASSISKDNLWDIVLMSTCYYLKTNIEKENLWNKDLFNIITYLLDLI